MDPTLSLLHGSTAHPVLPTGLTMTRIHWVLAPQGVTQIPTWKGSLLRGALGWTLSEVAQAAPAPGWPGLQTHSFAEALFDHQRAWNDARAVAPWALSCTDSRCRFAPGEAPLTGSMTCYGPWEPWAFALLEDCWERVARQGLGRQRTAWRLVGWEIEHQPITTHQISTATLGAIECTTRSPCRPPASSQAPGLDPVELSRCLLRRYRQLCRQMTGEDPLDVTDGRRLHADAAHLQIQEHVATERRLARFSSRQGRRHPLPAVTGTVRFTGPNLSLWAPLWALAPWLHIGKQGHFGLGCCEVEFLPRIPREAATRLEDTP